MFLYQVQGISIKDFNKVWNFSGKKTCLHIHGVFPYIYIPCTIKENIDSYVYQLATSIDSALNTSFGSTSSTNQHVYKIQQVSGM